MITIDFQVLHEPANHHLVTCRLAAVPSLDEIVHLNDGRYQVRQRVWWNNTRNGADSYTVSVILRELR